MIKLNNTAHIKDCDYNKGFSFRFQSKTNSSQRTQHCASLIDSQQQLFSLRYNATYSYIEAMKKHFKYKDFLNSQKFSKK